MALQRSHFINGLIETSEFSIVYCYFECFFLLSTNKEIKFRCSFEINYQEGENLVINYSNR